MPDLGNAILKLVVRGDGFKKGLATAEQQTTKFAAKGEKQVGRVRGAFGKLGKEVDGALGKNTDYRELSGGVAWACQSRRCWRCPRRICISQDDRADR